MPLQSCARRVRLLLLEPPTTTSAPLPEEPLPPPSKTPLPLSQTPLQPPLQPPHLPQGLSLPNPVSQYGLGNLGMNAPLTYVHPYGAIFYPLAYPPVPHHPHYASNTAISQPWGYPQHPMMPQPGPFLGYLLANQHTTPCDKHLPICDGTIEDAPLLTEGRRYPNKQVSPGCKLSHTFAVRYRPLTA